MRIKKLKFFGTAFLIVLMISIYQEYQKMQIKKQSMPGSILKQQIEEFDFDLPIEWVKEKNFSKER